MQTDAPRPRPSSTVVLVRPGAEAPEILMVKRHARSAFGSAYAFPGGVLEPADRLVHAHCAGIDAAAADRQLAVARYGLDYFSAAVRELFEEAGVLLASSLPGPAALEVARSALNAGTLAWDRFVEEQGLTLLCDRLHYFGFWITPEGLPKRYSTRFFLAELPAEQEARHCGAEITDSIWMPAREVLAAGEDGRMRVHYPTRKTLESLARLASVSDLCSWASDCAARGVVCDQPAAVPAEYR
jgi:8-oxo-dGTP pyrophosphatase MutT (NUDIX family)